ncbi:hypothetical protein DIPPA_09180 [Diplonema papillatum]|nr:hypothetical protein DIPPA_09180 [Diplonema papillatum]
MQFMFSSAARVVGAAGGVLGASYVGRNYLGWADQKDGPARDNSTASINVFRRLPKKILVEYREAADGSTKVGIVDEHLYTDVVKKHVLRFEESRPVIKQKVENCLREELDAAFQPITARIPRFADWYFSYSTTYTFVSKIVTSTTVNALSLTRTTPISDEVTKDLERLLQNKYQDIVLRPDLSDPVLQRCFARSLQVGHEAFMEELHTAEQDILKLVEATIPHALALPFSKLNLDWRAQADKAGYLHNTFEKSPESSVGLLATGTVVGKTIGSAAAAKAGGGTLASKLISPFLSPTVLSTMGALGGPGGAMLGAGIGLGVDVLVNKGTSLMQRGQFEADVSEAVQSAKQQWYHTSRNELFNAVDVWIGDSVQSLYYVKTA